MWPRSRSAAVGADVLDSLTPGQQVIKIVNEELTALMGGANAELTFASQRPTIVMMVGLQGAGKTTNGAKLAGLMRRQFGKRPLLVACDVYRPAAINQLQVVGRQLDIPVFEDGSGATRYTSPRRPSSTPGTTATTWSFWIPPAGCTSTRP